MIALAILLGIVGEVSTSTAAACAPDICLLYRKAAIEWRANSKRNGAELATCREAKDRIQQEHEHAIADFVKDASAPPPMADGPSLNLIITFALAGLVGLAGFAGGLAIGMHAH